MPVVHIESVYIQLIRVTTGSCFPPKFHMNSALVSGQDGGTKPSGKPHQQLHQFTRMPCERWCAGNKGWVFASSRLLVVAMIRCAPTQLSLAVCNAIYRCCSQLPDRPDSVSPFRAGAVAISVSQSRRAPVVFTNLTGHSERIHPCCTFSLHSLPLPRVPASATCTGWQTPVYRSRLDGASSTACATV